MAEGLRIKLNNRRSIFALIVLAIFGILGNWLSVPLYRGVDFLFGSIAVLIITEVYGIRFGLTASIIASLQTYFLWEHPYGILIFGLEAIFVGLLKKRYKNIIVRDVLYWIFVGMPVIWVIYKSRLGLSTSGTMVIILKEFVNGVFNSLMASIFISHVPLKKWITRSGKRHSIQVSQIMFNVVAGSVLIPAILLSIIISNNEMSNIHEKIDTSIMIQTKRMGGVVYSWQKERLQALKSIANYVGDNGLNPTNELQSQVQLVVEAIEDFKAVYAADRSGNTVSVFPIKGMHEESAFNYNYSDRPYFDELLERDKVIIRLVLAGKVNSQPALTMSVPITDKETKEIIGFITGEIDISALSGMLMMTTYGEEQYITILDDDNRVLATTNPEFINLQILRKGLYDFSEIEEGVIGRIEPKYKELTSMERWRKSYYTKYESIGYNNDWKLIIHVPYRPYQDQMKDFYTQNLKITIVLIIVALILGIILSRLLTNPIRKLSLATNHLPSKLLIGEDIEWPFSKVFEVETLINNFKQTAIILRHKFREVREARDKLEEMAYYDQMTGLPNRIMFKNELERKIVEAKVSDKKLGVMFLDLDRFKIVNDTLGHAQGDELLKLVSLRISNCIPKDSLLARIGGDEFILLIDEFKSCGEISLTAEAIIESLDSPFVINNQEFFVTVSVGIAIYPGDGENFEELTKNADLAMYKVKELGKKDYRFYDKFMNEELMEKVMLENRLRRAIEKEEFVLYYQPQLNLESNEVVGMEALIRWNNPEFGMVSPAKFIPLLEETGLILTVGEWVIRTACKQNKLWQEAGLNPIKVSVNLSAKQFQQKSLINKIEDILSETGLDAKWLELEITESIAIEDVNFTVNTLKELKNMGVNISLDDFGTGFSSLSYLKNFKIDTLKIDASFVKDIYSGESDASIVNTIISLAKNLRLKVIAEGVETEMQLGFLKQNGCDEIQGYIYSKPLTNEELGAFLKKYIQ